MRSAETSGVRAKGFDTARKPADSNGLTPRELFSPLLRLLPSAPAGTLAVAGTALLATLAFVAVDAARTLNDSTSRMQLLARAVAGEIALLDSKTAAPAAQRLVNDYDPRLLAALQVASTAAPASPDALRAEASAGPLGTLILDLDKGAALAGVWQRGLAAAAVALVLIALRLRLHPTRGMPGSGERLRLETFVATIPFGVACWTRKGALIVCNQHYLARLNGDGPALERSLSYQAAVTRLTEGGYVRLVSEGRSNRIIELHRQDGSCLLIDERPLADGGFVTLVTDISERKRTDLLLNSIQEEQRQLARRYHEEKLRAEAASRAKISFLAHLSHDIRTPLNHIIGFAELIQQQTYGPLGDTRYQGYVETIKTSGERLLSSFATILELAELESGQKALREEHFGVDDLLAATMRRFAAQAKRAGLTLRIAGPCGAMLAADRFCLERMVGNLVENSIRFTPSGGRVTLAAYAATDGVVLEVSDTGIGMTEERLATLSQPFAFGDAAFTKEHEGAGLGIAIARAIAELSGGRLAIDSRPALGTTVAISLPRTTAKTARAA